GIAAIKYSRFLIVKYFRRNPNFTHPLGILGINLDTTDASHHIAPFDVLTPPFSSPYCPPP
ncbi:MAG: hypothetical protein ACXWIU_12720, partial [Limisphaerales bacterium]